MKMITAASLSNNELISLFNEYCCQMIPSCVAVGETTYTCQSFQELYVNSNCCETNCTITILTENSLIPCEPPSLSPLPRTPPPSPLPLVPPSSPPEPLYLPVHQFEYAGSAENFRKLTPKPQLSLILTSPVEIDELRFKQRQMSYADSCIRYMEVIVEDTGNFESTHVADFGEARADNTTGTLLTDLSVDPYGRVGDTNDTIVTLLAPTLVKRITMRIYEIHQYDPPDPLPDFWTSPQESKDYFGPYTKNGAWNVGLTMIKLLRSSQTIDQNFLSGATIEHNGEYGKPQYDHRNPFTNAYRWQVFSNSIGQPVTYAWSWPGQNLLAGLSPEPCDQVVPTTPENCPFDEYGCVDNCKQSGYNTNTSFRILIQPAKK